MKKLSGILFDFNGTLFFDSKIHLETFKKIFKMYNKPEMSDRQMIRTVFGRTSKNIFIDNFKSNATDEECEAFRILKEGLYYDICLSNPEIFKLADGVQEMLNYLKAQRIPYCIVTGSSREEMEFFIEHLGLERWFSWDNIIYTDGSFRGKPAPDCYRIAAERISLTTGDCIVFEDGVSGIAAARAADAGAVIAIYEQGIPTPVSDGVAVDGEYHDLTSWRDIFAEYGLFSM